MIKAFLKQKIIQSKRKNSSLKTVSQENRHSIKKWVSELFFDKIFAHLFSPFFNLYHKGSILELYFKKK